MPRPSHFRGPGAARGRQEDEKKDEKKREETNQGATRGSQTSANYATQRAWRDLFPRPSGLLRVPLLKRFSLAILHHAREYNKYLARPPVYGVVY